MASISCTGGKKNVYAATSDNLTDWDPLLDENGELLKLFSPRSGYFDSQLTECGPPAILTKDGIVLLYNGKTNREKKGIPLILRTLIVPDKHCSM